MIGLSVQRTQQDIGTTLHQITFTFDSTFEAKYFYTFTQVDV